MIAYGCAHARLSLGYIWLHMMRIWPHMATYVHICLHMMNMDALMAAYDEDMVALSYAFMDALMIAYDEDMDAYDDCIWMRS